MQALEHELARERARAETASAEAQKEASLARRALEEASTARTEREEYRRVLAAAIANEKKSLQEARAATDAYGEVEGRLSARLAEEVYARGLADGRARELERSKSETMARHVHELAEVRDREWAEREERRREVQRLVFELGEAHAAVRAVESGGGREHLDPEARARRHTALVARGVSVFAACRARALAPAALLAAFSPARAAYLTLALGLGPWSLTLVTLSSGLVALGCAMLALRVTRAAAPAAPRSASDTRSPTPRESLDRADHPSAARSVG
jgi:hypothetical protein